MFKPTIGPIIGHTTTNHARIFVRGAAQKNAPVFAGIRYRRSGHEQWIETIFAKLTSLQDMSDVLVLDNLAPDTEYEYQAGWFSTRSAGHTADSLQELPLRWPKELYHLRTRSGSFATPRGYFVGSCRYLRMTAGVASAPEWGDRIFASIAQLAQQADPPVSAMLMTGDQIYVDDLNFFAPDREYQQILAKYRAAFSQPHVSRLMANISTYMILDDHEIEDNWPDKKKSGDDILYNNAISAYEIYQASHSPVFELFDDGRISRLAKHYWYQFSDGDIEWFVTDGRTRRNLSANDRRLLDNEQEYALCQWLIHSPARVKLVVTSVMFFPDARQNGNDAWAGFPAQRLRLLETIRLYRLKNVIFVAGDVHASMTSRLTHSEDPGFEVHTIVSSPLCNSRLLPYASQSGFILDRPLARTAAGEYRQELTGKVISQDNFAHLVIDAKRIRVNYHDRDGELLQSTAIELR
ncbi:phosphodiesterase [Pseudomonas sp. Root68]|uniref:alkaline phosphatase D family protein n=1 Tax=unclassified Pseudomonas TaxID=196821 RepID=UPI0006F31D24|nr:MULTISPECIES: alkaline phosphatase D family protein [unclassified Pseudomonas]KRA93824.1 phosphodiesterase [Pseudomonas sp. Root68]KRB64894.1 phosphodiesterase [Pseudomonas sp. Root71]